jgi:hypothetical protein
MPLASINRTAVLVIVLSCIVLIVILSIAHSWGKSCIENFETMTPVQKARLQELYEYANENLEKIAENAKEQKALNKKIAKQDIVFCDDFTVKRLFFSDQWQKTQEQDYLIGLGSLLDTLPVRNKQQKRVTVC